MGRKNVAQRAPGRGDIVRINFSPTRGHEQSGYRPAVVVSVTSFNQKTGMALVVPVTSRAPKYATEVWIETATVGGTALVPQARFVDWKHRPFTYADRCPEEALRDIQGMLVAFITDGDN